MNTKINDKALQEMVFRCLSRILKNRKMYHKFRCFVGYGGNGVQNHNLTTTIYSSLNCMRNYVDMAKHSDSPFLFTSTKEDIFRILSKMVDSENAIHEGETDDGKIQMRIAQYLNTLLHCCVERTVGDFSEIERIGQDTFEMVCKQIFGDDFVDETEKNLPDNVKQMLEAQRDFMGEHGMVDPRMLSRDNRFLEFLKSRGMIGRRNREESHIEMVAPTNLDFMANHEWYNDEWDSGDYEWDLDANY